MKRTLIAGILALAAVLLTTDIVDAAGPRAAARRGFRRGVRQGARAAEFNRGFAVGVNTRFNRGFFPTGLIIANGGAVLVANPFVNVFVGSRRLAPVFVGNGLIGPGYGGCGSTGILPAQTQQVQAFQQTQTSSMTVTTEGLIVQ